MLFFVIYSFPCRIVRMHGVNLSMFFSGRVRIASSVLVGATFLSVPSAFFVMLFGCVGLIWCLFSLFIVWLYDVLCLAVLAVDVVFVLSLCVDNVRS